MFRISKAVISDLEGLIQVQAAAFENDLKTCGSAPPGFDSLSYQKEVLDRLSYYSIKQDDEIVGGFYYEILGQRLNLIRLFIHPQNQRNGIGKQVIDFLSRDNLGIKSIELETPDFSYHAQKFYEKNGFNRIKMINYGVASSLLYRLIVK